MIQAYSSVKTLISNPNSKIMHKLKRKDFLKPFRSMITLRLHKCSKHSPSWCSGSLLSHTKRLFLEAQMSSFHPQCLDAKHGLTNRSTDKLSRKSKPSAECFPVSRLHNRKDGFFFFLQTEPSFQTYFFASKYCKTKKDDTLLVELG